MVHAKSTANLNTTERYGSTLPFLKNYLAMDKPFRKQLLKPNCVRCGDKIPMSKKYNAVYGNWCPTCSGETGTHHSKKIRKSIVKTPLEVDLVKEVRLAEKMHTEMVRMTYHDKKVLRKSVHMDST